MIKQKSLQSFINLTLLIYTSLFFLRLAELFLISKYQSFTFELIKYELIGFIFDFLKLTPVLFLLLMFLYPILKKQKKYYKTTGISIILILSTLHILILNYFSHELKLLDIFLFKYSLKEISYTMSSVDVNYPEIIIILFVTNALIIISNKIIHKIKFSNQALKTSAYIILIITSLSFILAFYKPFQRNKFVTNKSIYFYTKTVQQFFRDNSKTANINDVKIFQNQYKAKEFISSEYPLLHKFEIKDILGENLNQKNDAPNIVILIVEGLNDDFIHQYKGVQLMPFLNNLSSESLYWNKCFTVGERSFAVVPSILGGLPYGEKGFTYLDKYPYHHTLVSLLNVNNYYTSFFYGQGSWFHRKSKFLTYNNIDLIFDNAKFADKYEKIIVNDFFWGYNDKDLFNQSLEVIDTLPKQKRLDIYFTGTTHFPFKIINEKYYTDRLKKLKNTSNDNTDFFETYDKYLKSILFTDDALKDFFDNYRKKEEFENTIFIITGDHPMTEIPIQNSLKRFHVPLLIYSPLLKKAKKYNSIVSHLDVYETIMSFLGKNYDIKVPVLSSSLGESLDTTKSYIEKNVAFMNDNRDVVDFYSNGYFLSENYLFKVTNELNLIEIESDTLKKSILLERETFNTINLYTSLNNKLIPDSAYCKSLNYQIIYSNSDSKHQKSSSEYLTLIDKTLVPNTDIFIDLSFNSENKFKNSASVVFEITDEKDSSLYWSNTSLNSETTGFQVRQKIPKQSSSNTKIYLKSYVWNKKKESIEYSELNTLVYED